MDIAGPNKKRAAKSSSTPRAWKLKDETARRAQPHDP